MFHYNQKAEDEPWCAKGGATLPANSQLPLTLSLGAKFMHLCWRAGEEKWSVFVSQFTSMMSVSSLFVHFNWLPVHWLLLAQSDLSKSQLLFVTSY